MEDRANGSANDLPPRRQRGRCRTGHGDDGVCKMGKRRLSWTEGTRKGDKSGNEPKKEVQENLAGVNGASKHGYLSVA